MTDTDTRPSWCPERRWHRGYLLYFQRNFPAGWWAMPCPARARVDLEAVALYPDRDALCAAIDASIDA